MVAADARAVNAKVEARIKAKARVRRTKEAKVKAVVQEFLVVRLVPKEYVLPSLIINART